jgi:hypothetical protein
MAEAGLISDLAQQTLLNNYGVFTFNNGATKNALSDFLIGIPSAITQDAPVTGYTNMAGASRRLSSCAAACRSPSPTATSTPTWTATPTTGRS